MKKVSDGRGKRANKKGSYGKRAKRFGRFSTDVDFVPQDIPYDSSITTFVTVPGGGVLVPIKSTSHYIAFRLEMPTEYKEWWVMCVEASDVGCEHVRWAGTTPLFTDDDYISNVVGSLLFLTRGFQTYDYRTKGLVFAKLKPSTEYKFKLFINNDGASIQCLGSVQVKTSQ